MSRPWLAFYPTDYLADTRDLSAEEHGVYCVLLMESWCRGPLPDDLDRLRRMAAGAQAQSVRLVLERYWTRGEAGWTNARLERERARAEEQSQKQRRKAQLRWDAAACATALPRDMPDACRNDAPSQPQPHKDYYPTQNKPADKAEDGAPSALVRLKPDGGDGVEAPPINGTPYQAIVALFHEVLVPPLPRVTRLSRTRKEHLAARWKDELPALETWREYFEYVRDRTKLVKGWSFEGRLWRPDFDWLINPNNVLKVEEHKYDR